MRHSKFAAIAIALFLAPASLSASCFASYKAKQDNPLKLHFGVAQISEDACSPDGAASALAPRLQNDGWTLLTIVEIVAEEKLEEVKESAGAYFLRY